MNLYDLFLEEGIDLNHITEESVRECMMDFKLSEYNPVLVHIGVNGKTCSSCKQTKIFTEFDKQKLGKYGYRSTCKACRRVAEQPYNKKYYEENIEFIKLRKQEYRQTHKEQILEYNRKYVASHKEWARATAKKYKEDGRYDGKKKAYYKQYHLANRSQRIAYSKLYKKLS
ncbi:Putative HNH endonuclease [Pacmanvirus A23]|uniref:endonuclease VII n=1 Tax=Pacmanvirus A23 TaxID=1932881 RepID=UPI000A094FE3|nr:endonuclease VII [Pacmanvirus A23]SIP86057.1 Putative HNH endonuclease [Pacmanvirus A23]